MDTPDRVELLARALIRAVYIATAGQPALWRFQAELNDATRAALALAVERGWLLIEGSYTCRLTDAGRKVAKAPALRH